MTTIRRRNPRRQGEIGLGAAIAWFSANGWLVSIPLCDNQPYDLVVDDGQQLAKVQVKTTTCRNPAGNFVVDLRTTGGNQSFSTSKLFDPSASDILFVLTDAGEQYAIPCAEFSARSQLSLSAAYERYRL